MKNLTDEEKKMYQAYNYGYLLSQHEPVLLDKIIKRNKDNEFVKMMSVGRDHHHFNVNMPRKEHTKAFKNGFYNGRTLAEHQPGMISKLRASKELPKDYKRGLEAAEKEFKIISLGKKIDSMPKVPPKDLRKDNHFRKGFNVGYRLSENHNYALNAPHAVNEKYSKFIEGIKFGQEQYKHDKATVMEKDPTGRLFPEDPQKSAYQNALFDQKATSLNDVAKDQLQTMSENEAISDVDLPKWMQKKETDKEPPSSQKEKSKGKDIDLDV